MNQDEQVTSITTSDIDAAIQDERMIELERRAALIEEQRLQVVANTAVIAQQLNATSTLRLQVAAMTTLIAIVERLTDRLVDQQTIQAERIEKLETEAGGAITALANGGIELDKRLEELETCAMINAETIGCVVGLRHAAVERDRRITELEQRIEKLEAALETWLIAVNYTAATPPMSEMDVTAGKLIHSTPE